MNSVEPKLRSFGGRAFRPTASKTIYRGWPAVASLAALSLAGFMLTSAACGQQAQTDPLADTQLSSAQLAERTLHRRAVEAVVWGMPAVNYDLMYQAMVRDAKAGAGSNKIVYWSRLSDWKNQTLTPNPDSVYFMPFLDTKDVGPVVLEIPPADEGGSITGSVMDCWQAALEDVGPAGVDKGKGGKCLILPPGYKEKIPDGYIVLPSDNFQGYALLRSILQTGGDAAVAKAVAYAKRVKLYPLSQASNPPETMFIDASGVVFEANIPYDASFFQSLDRMVQSEPWLTRDKAMIDPLRTIGIEKGKAFNPDAKTRAILDDAAKEARAWLETKYQAAFSPAYFDGTGWAVPGAKEVMEGMSTQFANPDSYPIDGRGLAYSLAFFSPKHLGAGQFYLMTFKDKAGKPFDGRGTYRLTVPPNAPVKQYWSATVYNRATHALIRNLPWSSRSSQTPVLQKNADGSVDIYFGPEAPPGKESNWVPTSADGKFEVLFRLYGPEKPLFDKTWQLPDIEKINLSEGGAVKEFAPATPASAQNITQQLPAGGGLGQTADTRIGSLSFERGLPTEDTVTKLFDALDFQRACQAYVWALPLVGIGSFQRAHYQAFDAGDGDIVTYQTYRDKLGILTPNATTPYIVSFVNLARTGPVVVDLPAGPNASGVCDFWQHSVTDMGQTGPDEGKGGKYLIVGPG